MTLGTHLVLMLLSRLVGGLSLESSMGSSCPPEKLVVYKLELQTFWDEQTFPKQYPQVDEMKLLGKRKSDFPPQWRPSAQWSKTVGEHWLSKHKNQAGPSIFHWRPLMFFLLKNITFTTRLLPRPIPFPLYGGQACRWGRSTVCWNWGIWGLFVVWFVPQKCCNIPSTL